MPKPASELVRWARVKLSADSGMTEGELVLRADRTRIDDDHVVFLVADQVVYRLERRYFRAMAWFVDQPTFGEWLRARREQFPNSHTRWSEVEIERLTFEVAHRWAWERIAKEHGRTVAAVKARFGAVSDGH
jgi:hypothetical protein